jgi:hypothetical protein
MPTAARRPVTHWFLLKDWGWEATAMLVTYLCIYRFKDRFIGSAEQ